MRAGARAEMRIVASMLAALLVVACGQVPPISGQAVGTAGGSAQTVGERPYIGLGLSAVDTTGGLGLRVNSVYPGSPADTAGVEIGDVVVGIDGEVVSTWERSKATERFRARILSTVPGQSVRLRLSRAGVVQERIATPEIPRIGAGPKVLKNDAAIHPEWMSAEPVEEERIAERLTASHGATEDYRDLRARLARLSGPADPFRIDEVAYLQRNPFRMRAAADAMAARIRPVSEPVHTAQRFLIEAMRLLQGNAPDAQALSPLPPLKTGLSPKAHMDQLATLLAQADAAWTEAFKALSAEELDFLHANADALARQVESSGTIYEDPDRERRLRNVRVIELAARVNTRPLIESAMSLVRVGEAAYLAGLRRDLELAGLKLSTTEVLNEKTPHGEILIGGTGGNRYANLDARGVAILIDLGGNDFYANRVAASSKTRRVALVVDAAGDDAYESNTDYAQASGFLGTGILVDVAGNDSYIGTRMSQGASLLGVGLLVDSAGDDRYRALTYSQGSAFWGAAGLIEASGNDSYDALLVSQAVGIAGGIGGLIDGGGNDSYYAKGAVPSGYGTPGTFAGWSQGVGLGLRGYASGGVGILYDSGGDNRMESGDFCQGGGYYFGWGLVFAGSGNDRYIGSRYAQGFSAHYALGTFIEAGGNDAYETRDAVAAGLAWDVSVTWFEDRGGDDTYPAQGFSIGASAQNSITVFIDRAGKDRIVGDTPPAIGQLNDYHGGASLSLVFLRAEGFANPAGMVHRDRHTFVIDEQRAERGAQRD